MKKSKSVKKIKLYGVVCQKREKGYSLHFSFSDLALYEDPCLPLSKTKSDEKPYICVVDEKTFSELQESGHGILYRDNDCPARYTEDEKREISFYDMNVREMALQEQVELKMACETIKSYIVEELKEKYKDCV